MSSIKPAEQLNLNRSERPEEITIEPEPTDPKGITHIEGDSPDFYKTKARAMETMEKYQAF